MSPRVEGLRGKEQGEVICFFVDLTSEVPFDPQAFDTNVSSIVNKFGHAKFVVVSDRLWIFPWHIMHINFVQGLEAEEKEGKLQCAGMLIVSGPIRLLSGSSPSLVRRLPDDDSEKYKTTKLQEVLGEFFAID